MTRLPAIAALSMLAAMFPVASPAQQGYPSKPIRVIVPMPPGAGQDILSRKIGEEMLPRLGQPFLIDNRPGGANIPAVEACARAAPDGYTICILSVTSNSLNPHVFAKLPYDPDRDFKPIANLYTQIEGLIVHGAVKANTLAELRALAVANPGKLNFGTLGDGSGPDVFRQWLAEGWNTKFQGIPYKGGNLVISALVSGEVDVGWIGAYNVGGQAKAGKVKILAVGSSKRLRLLPDIPTIAEAGIGEKPQNPWVAYGAPAGTPDAVITRLNRELNAVFHDPKFVAYMEEQYIESLIGTPQELGAFMKKDREAYGLLVRKYNIPRQ